MTEQLFATNDAATFRRRVFDVEAIRSTRDNVGEVLAWLKGKGIAARPEADTFILGWCGPGFGTAILHGAYVVIHEDGRVRTMGEHNFIAEFAPVTS